MRGEDLLDQADRVVAAAADPEAERLDVPAFPLGERRRGGRCRVHGGAPLGDLLVEIERDGERRAREREVRIVADRLSEPIDRIRAEAEQPSHPTIIGVDGGGGRG